MNKLESAFIWMLLGTFLIVFLMLSAFFLLIFGITFVVNFASMYISFWQYVLIVLALSVLITIVGIAKSLNNSWRDM